MSDLSSEFDPVEEVAESFLARYRRGEQPTLGEYAERYPHLAERLHEVFPALLLMEEAGAAGAGVPACLGEYRLVREVGRGGMGVVYEAVQEPLGRRVALKVLPFSRRTDPRRLERFRREAQAAARLHHTNIVPVFGVGEDQGVHFYAMQFIHGEGLDAILGEVRRRRQQGASPERGTSVTGQVVEGLLSGQFSGQEAPSDPVPLWTVRKAAGEAASRAGLGGQTAGDYYRGAARVGVQAAEALDYAHRHGVLHRDVKPSNLLLDTEGTVWVTDFGLAKAEGSTDLTEDGDLVGTMRYMAPERFRGICDPRCDVYALGLTLYELLVLRPAFEGEDRPQLLEQVLHGTPPPPRGLDPRIPRDLETVVLKAMAREPEARYPTAAALAEDLHRFLSERPVQARRVGLLERGWRWCRRNPAVAILTQAVAVALLAGTAVAWHFALRAADKASEAESSARAAEGQAARAREEQEGAERHLYLSRMHLAQVAWREGNLDRLEELLAEMKPRPGRPDPRHFEWYTLDRLHNAAPVSFRIAGTVLLSLAYSPDGNRLAGGTWDGQVLVWDAATGKELMRFQTGNGNAWSLAFSPDGSRLACGSGLAGGPPSQSPVGEVVVWDLGGRREVLRLRETGGSVLGVAFSPDGQRLAGALSCIRSVTYPRPFMPAAGTVKVWDAVTGKVVRSFGPGLYSTVAFSPDGQRLAIGGAGVSVWDLAGERRVFSLPTQCTVVAFSPDGKHLALAPLGEGGAQLCDAATGKEVARLAGPLLTTLAFSPDGKHLAGGSVDKTARVWDLRTRQQALVLKHVHEVTGVAYSPNGKRLAAGSQGGAVKVWDALRGAEPPSLGDPKWSFRQTAYSPDGRRLLAWDLQGLVSWDTDSGRERFRIKAGVCDAPHALAFHPDGRRTAAACRDGKGRVWDAGGRELLVLGSPARPLSALAFGNRGRHLLGTTAGAVLVWDADTGRLLRTIAVEPSGSPDAAFSPDGRYAAWPQGPRDVALWDLEAGRGVCLLRGHTQLVLGLAFSADGSRLASCSRDQTVRVWQRADGRELFVLKGHTEFVHGVAFSADGRRLASAACDRTLRLWDLTTGQEALTLELHASSFPLSIAFHPDGRHMACVMAGGGALTLLGPRWEGPPTSPTRQRGFLLKTLAGASGW